MIVLIAFLGMTPARAARRATLDCKEVILKEASVPIDNKLEGDDTPTSEKKTGKKVVTVRMKGIIFDKKTQDKVPNLKYPILDTKPN